MPQKKPTPLGSANNAGSPQGPRDVGFEFDFGKWRMRVSEHEIVQGIRNHPIRVGITLACVVFVIATYFLMYRGHAETAVFYPSTCLGGWKNPGNATGQPSTQEGQSDQVTEENAAALVNTSAELFCGDFGVTAPVAGTEPAQITLVPYWRITDTPLPPLNPVTPATSGSDATHSENPFIPDIVPPIPGIDSGSIQSAPSPDTTNSGTPATTPDSNQTSPSDSTTPASQPAPVESAPAQDAAPSTPAPAPAADSAPSALRFFVPVTYAQEESSSVPVAPLANTSSTADTADQIVTSSVVPAEDTIAEVRYTLDGQTWHVLGRVNRTNWQGARFQFPITSAQWSDLAHLQISVLPLSTIDPVPSLYIDGFRLDMEYDASAVQVATSTQAYDPALLHFDYAIVSDLPSRVTIMNDAQGERLHVEGLPAGNLDVRNTSDPTFQLSLGIGDAPIDLPLSYFPPGKYLAVLTSDSVTCGPDNQPCAPHTIRVGGFSFGVSEHKPTEATTTTSTPNASSTLLEATTSLATSTKRTETETTTPATSTL
jgi:hypothetical protein